MKRRAVKRLGVAAILIVCLAALVGPAAADSDQELSIGDVTVNEGGTATFVISLTDGVDDDADVHWATSNGSATAGQDYTASSGDVTVPKNGSVQVTVQIANDTTDENNENFTVTLSNAVRAVIPDPTATGTITDDDAQPTTTGISDATVAEGSSGTGAVMANFVVSLSAASGKTITINYSTVNGSAIAPGDYTAEVNVDLTIAPGSTSGTISIPVIGDTLPEPNETFTVNLNSGTNVTIAGDTQGQATITDDDSAPTVTIGDPATVTEDNVNVSFPVTLSAPAPAPVTITWTTTDGSAVAPGDYDAASGPALVIGTGSSSGTITVGVNEDALPEGTENFHVDLQNATGATLQADRRGTATITDDDSAPTVTIGDPAAVTEDNVNVSFPVTLSSAAPAPVTITWTTTDGSAVAPGDYDAASGPALVIPAGQSSGTIQVGVNEDSLPEGTENFHVDLQTASGAQLQADRRGTATITDDDSAPSASINDVTVTEGNTPNTVNATFTVTLSSAAAAPVQIRYSTVNNSAVGGSAGAGDFTTVTNGTVSIAQGGTSGTLTIVVNGDNVPEGSGTPRVEVFFVDLVSTTGPVTISSDFRGIGTITDDDAVPTVTAISDPTVTEGNEGQVDANFEVTLSGNALAPVGITFATADGSATAPSDYAAQSGTLTIPVGQSKGTITVKVNGDVAPEGNEDFHVDLTSVSLAQFGPDRRGTATIENDDAARTLTIAGVTVTEGTGAGNAVNMDFKVKLSGTTSQAVSVIATTSDGSATAPADYQAKTQVIQWAPNTPTEELEKTFRVIVNPDSLDEANETLIVTLTSPQNAVVSGATATGTINDNDNNALLAVSNAEANEGTGGTTSKMTFKVTLSPASARPVTANYATANGTATAGSDYEAKSGQLSFAPGETEKTIEIVILGDDVNEENETVLVNLSDVAGAGLSGGGGQGSGTIVDKNAPPSLSINDVQAREGEGGTFTVTLAGTTLRTVSVTFGTSGGTATEGKDFLPRNGTLTFAPGEKTKTIAVTVFDDTDAEPAETFAVGLGNPVNATITKASGIGTIEASDLGEVAGPPVTPQAPIPTTPIKKPTTAGPQIFPQMVLGPRVVTMKSGRAQMTVTCAKTSKIACSGSIMLQTTTKPALKLGQKSFSVKKGKKAVVTIVIAKDVRTLIEKVRSIQVKVVVYVKTNKKKNLRVDPGVITVKSSGAARSTNP